MVRLCCNKERKGFAFVRNVKVLLCKECWDFAITVRIVHYDSTIYILFMEFACIGFTAEPLQLSVARGCQPSCGIKVTLRKGPMNNS